MRSHRSARKCWIHVIRSLEWKGEVCTPRAWLPKRIPFPAISHRHTDRSERVSRVRFALPLHVLGHSIPKKVAESGSMWTEEPPGSDVKFGNGLTLASEIPDDDEIDEDPGRYLMFELKKKRERRLTCGIFYFLEPRAFDIPSSCSSNRTNCWPPMPLTQRLLIIEMKYIEEIGTSILANYCSYAGQHYTTQTGPVFPFWFSHHVPRIVSIYLLAFSTMHAVWTLLNCTCSCYNRSIDQRAKQRDEGRAGIDLAYLSKL